MVGEIKLPSFAQNGVLPISTAATKEDGRNLALSEVHRSVLAKEQSLFLALSFRGAGYDTSALSHYSR